MQIEHIALYVNDLEGARDFFVIGAPDELDGELFGWVEQAYQFAETKGKR